MSNSKSRKSRKQSRKVNTTQVNLSGFRIANNKPIIYKTTLLLTGGNMTPATTTGYSYTSITSNLWTSTSPWTQLAALYMFCRPIACNIVVTANRATGTTDNPVISIIPTPDGNPVGNLGMNLSTLEASGSIPINMGPGVSVRRALSPYVQQALFNTVISGYQAIKPGRLSLSSLPLVYYGDICLYTPGVNVSTVTNYVQIRVDFVFEFSVLKNSTQ